MLTILDLPNEILELIYIHLITTPTQWLVLKYPSAVAASTAGCLRLVCRQWAELFYERHLYRGLKFSSDARTIEFIRHIRGRSKLLPRARCQHLVIDRIWAVEPRPEAAEKDLIESETLEYLLGLFSDTIVTLVLKFVDCLSLYDIDIENIGRIENLSDLHLDISTASSGNSRWPTAHPADFTGLMVAVKGVKSLLLDMRISLPDTLEFNGLIGDRKYPPITHLGVTLFWQQPSEILRLVKAFQPSLKALTIQSNGTGWPDEQFTYPERDELRRSVGLEPPTLRRVYEYLKDKLEGLFITSSHIIGDSLDLRFNKLRVFVVQYWGQSITDYLSREIFTHAPIEILAIDAVTAVEDCEPRFIGNPLSNLPHLKKLVFMQAPCDYSAPQKFLDACEALGVRCVYVDHCEMPLLMQL
ncbi:hypothetical protein Pst134EA_009405 [Puccinia striiformis f. sp. tritici]|uniref:hypothetical protein n=1 Tax=Puccinia striiformis f. sp. tritici TaxID=168172 RepID=UPI0020078E2A|nr:hypothetical protein Pst134EA_009405 [Puccinia striiformis f. sp. tritici]KAH9468876.1 hypothetical protein Pst134EA_009405 [Puccinia striiformis f. sp. tritici]